MIVSCLVVAAPVAIASGQVDPLLALLVALILAAVICLTSPRALQGGVDALARSKDWRVEIPVTAPVPAQDRRAATLGIYRTREY